LLLKSKLAKRYFTNNKRARVLRASFIVDRATDKVGGVGGQGLGAPSYPIISPEQSNDFLIAAAIHESTRGRPTPRTIKLSVSFVCACFGAVIFGPRG
jgi:hypothetical protein